MGFYVLVRFESVATLLLLLEPIWTYYCIKVNYYFSGKSVAYPLTSMGGRGNSGKWTKAIPSHLWSLPKNQSTSDSYFPKSLAADNKLATLFNYLDVAPYFYVLE